jgi:serine protease inhibitor
VRLRTHGVRDRPFLFALRENLSGTILFLGMIRRPPVN